MRPVLIPQIKSYVMVFWIHIEVTDFSILLIFKYKQYKNAKTW